MVAKRYQSVNGLFSGRKWSQSPVRLRTRRADVIRSHRFWRVAPVWDSVLCFCWPLDWIGGDRARGWELGFSALALIEKLFPRAFMRRRMAASHLGIIRFDFALYLRDSGYALRRLHPLLAVEEHFAHWMNPQSLRVLDLDEAVVERFVCSHLPGCRGPKPAPRPSSTAVPLCCCCCRFFANTDGSGLHLPEGSLGVANYSSDTPVHQTTKSAARADGQL